MTSSSPASIRSQAHNSRRVVQMSPMQSSDQEFRSQVPFRTQLPYDRSPSYVRRHKNPCPTSKSTSKYISQPTDTSAGSQHVRVSRVKGDELDGRELREAQQRPQTTTVSRDNRNEHEHGDEEATASSGGSIECEPLEQPTALSPVDEDLADLPVPRGQPFPLVEWIRRIREESKSEWPTSHLKWSRSISKRQKAILDADDSWFPPLPGRPVREGTIPIDILTALTRRVDQDAERQANKELQHSFQEPSRNPEPQTVASQLRHLPSSPPSQKSTDDADVPWSSSPPSPPRRPLPPDTSPPRPTASQGQQSAIVNETLRDTVHSVPAARSKRLDPLRKTPHSPFNSSDQNRPTPRSVRVRQGGREDESVAATDQVVRTCVPSQDKFPTPPSREDLPLPTLGRTTQMPKTISRPRPKIQVKNTPHPLKRLSRSREQLHVSNDLPQSSLVAGTYPDVTFLDRESRDPPEHQSSPAQQSFAAEVIVPQTGIQPSSAQVQQPERPPKRTFDKVNQETRNTATGSKSPHHHTVTSISNRSGTGRPERRLGGPDVRSPRKKSRNLAEQSPSSSESEVEKESRLRNEKLRVIKGLERSRAFRASHKRVPASNPQAVDKNIKAVSAAPSSPKSHGPTLADSRSEYEETSATNLSLHDTSNSIKPPSRNISRQTSVQVATNTGGLDETFQRFTRTYTDYSGSLRNFESAIRLLINLDSKPREPHPSLWDDFVFRMADDYRFHLQECIEEGENALPYQDFYYARVQQSEHRSGVVTKECLKIVTSSKIKASTPVRRSSSNLHSHIDVVMVDADMPNYELSRSHTTRSNARVVNDLQVPRDHTHPTRAEPDLILQTVDKVPSEDSGTEQGNTKKIGKDRGMPQSSNKSTLSSAGLAQILVSSGEQTSTTTAVQEWLSRPAGACSPEIEPTRTQALEQRAAITPSSATDQLRPAEKAVTEPSHVQDPDISRLRLPSYLASSKDTLIKDTTNESLQHLPSVTASDIAPHTERPVTPFTLYARNVASLHSERSVRSLPSSKKKIPINIHQWFDD